MLVYDTLEQARMRLRNSIITYQGRSCLVNEVNERKGNVLMVNLAPLPQYPPAKRSENIEVRIDDPDMNFRIFRLGYLNCPTVKRAAYITRHTRRQQIQGLSVSGLAGLQELDRQTPYREAMDDMLNGRYPTPDEALKMINEEGWVSVGISQHFALERDPNMRLLKSLMYRGRRVGVALGSKFSEFLVDKQDQYLEAVLSEAGFPFRVE